MGKMVSYTRFGTKPLAEKIVKGSVTKVSYQTIYEKRQKRFRSKYSSLRLSRRIYSEYEHDIAGQLNAGKDRPSTNFPNLVRKYSTIYLHLHSTDLLYHTHILRNKTCIIHAMTGTRYLNNHQ